MSFEDSEYILVVRQGESVVTIFFEDLLTDVHLYDYGEIGHFWVKSMNTCDNWNTVWQS